MILLVSFLHIVLLGLADALIKANVMAHYNDWSRVPWYFKDENFIYPVVIIGLLFGVTSTVAVIKKTNWGWKYFIFLALWVLGGLESLSYWFWNKTLRIGQGMWWLPDPDNSFFWWYPPEAPWLNRLYNLRLISFSENVTREAVLYGVLVAAGLNVILYIFIKSEEKIS
ncbi:hypothetical protein HQ544_02800 [Candidatus Falkowbacteria bacterium]|nr:hypothetical protein [Candidatus Falkowbacteria bacterium]